MTPGVYVAGSEPATGKSAVALGVQQLLARRVERLGVFRPVVADRRARPADRPAAAGVPPLRGGDRRQLRGGPRRRGARARGDRRALPRAGRAVRRRARGRHRLRRHGVRARVQRARGPEPRAAGAAGDLRARPHGRGDPDGDVGGADDLAPLGPRGRRHRRQPGARRPGGRDRRARRGARLRAAGGRPADGADRRAGRRRRPRHGDRGRPGAARPRGAAADRRGDDAAEPDGPDRRRRRS